MAGCAPAAAPIPAPAPTEAKPAPAKISVNHQPCLHALPTYLAMCGSNVDGALREQILYPADEELLIPLPDSVTNEKARSWSP